MYLTYNNIINIKCILGAMISFSVSRIIIIIIVAYTNIHILYIIIRIGFFLNN